MKRFYPILFTGVLLLAEASLAQNPPAPPTPTEQPPIRRVIRRGVTNTPPAAVTNTPPAAVQPAADPNAAQPAPVADPNAVQPAPAQPVDANAVQPVEPAAVQPVPATPPPVVAPPAVTIPVDPNAAAATPAPNVAGAVPATGMTANGLSDDDIIPDSDLKFNNQPLEQFLDIYARFVGRTLLRGATLPLNQQITIKAQTSLTRKEAIQAMDTVLALNGITMVPTGDKFVIAVPQAEAVQMGAKPSTLSASDLPEAAQYVTHIVQLKHVSPGEIQQVLVPFAKNPAGIVGIESSKVLVLRDYAINVKRMLEVIEKVDVMVPLEVVPEVIPIKYALASDIAQVIGTLSPSGSASAVGTSARRTTGTTTTGNRNATGSTFGTQGNNAANRAVTPQQNAATGNNSFQNRMQQIASRMTGSGELQILGEAKIIPDERLNAILVFASQRDIDMIKTIIAKLDVVLAQVLIEAIIMEVSLDNRMELGVSSRQPSRNFGNGVEGIGGINNGQAFNLATNLPGGFSYFTDFSGDFNVAVQAIAEDSTINVISKPRIQTSHAVPARFFVGDTVPYITGSTFGDFGSVGSRSSYSQLQVGVELQVTPLINPDGLVVMDINQVVEQLGTPQIIDGNEVPTTTKRDAQATVAVRDRDTIILGGFIKNDKTLTKSGVPYLKDIPLLGALFRKKNDRDRRTEMIVMMRPTVLKTPEAAALTAIEEKVHLPAIRQAENQYNKSEKKRRDKADSEMLSEQE